jgi:hypothetical protein
MSSPDNPAPHATRAPFVIAAGGLLAVAIALEAEFAGLHNVGLSALHEHTPVPLSVHAIAVGALVVSLWPVAADCVSAARRRRLDWQLAVVVIVLATLALGQTIAAALLAWLSSFGLFMWKRAVPGRIRQWR